MARRDETAYIIPGDRLEYHLERCIGLLERTDPPKGGKTDKAIRGAKKSLEAWKKMRDMGVELLMAEMERNRRAASTPEPQPAAAVAASGRAGGETEGVSDE